MTSVQCDLIKLFFLVVYLLGMSYQVVYAKALTSVVGPVQFETDWEGYFIEEGIYERQEYPYVGVYMELGVWRYDNPDDGDTWQLSLNDVATGQRLASETLVYDGGTDCFVLFGQTSFCGIHVPDDSNKYWTYPFYMAFISECLQTRDYNLNIEFLGDAMGGSPWEFRPTRFRPEINFVNYNSSLQPELPGDTFGSVPITRQPAESTNISFLVLDDLECNVPLEDVDVELTNTITSGTGGHEHFSDPNDPGTGKYESLNAADVFDSAQPHILKGKTDAYGRFLTRYTAGEFGISETITIEASRPETDKEPELVAQEVEKQLDIKVPGLTEMVPGLNGDFIFAFKGGCPHNPTARWATPNMKSRLLLLNALYNISFGGNLSFNDASLSYGGVIDNKNSEGRDSHCHQSHRRGIDIDVNAVDSKKVNMKEKYDVVNGLSTLRLDLLTKNAKDAGLEIVPEKNSIHYRNISRR